MSSARTSRSPTWNTAVALFNSWYKPGELDKRSGIFTSSGLAGTLLIHLASPAFSKEPSTSEMAFHHRWCDYLAMTMPIALYGFLNVPATTAAFYLTEEVEPDHDVTRHPLSWNLVKRVLTRWRWYGCSLLFATSGETESFGSNNLMGQRLSAIGGYSVEQVTDDYTRARWLVLVYMSFCCTIAAIYILVCSSPVGLNFFAYYIAGAAYSGQATTFASHVERINAVNAWWPLLFYPATDAPRFTTGMTTMICTCAATLERRERVAGFGSAASNLARPSTSLAIDDD
ncbi:hypothetical protein HD554DRAFT_2034596 [Boletus coccyginus]|nr:hypothetical protein HD554DRAFT_2034596 [Boletus coccyginus]